MAESFPEVLVAALTDAALDQLAARLAPRLARQSLDSPGVDQWMDTREAAAYLGVHRDTLRKSAAARCVPFEQDAPGCKLYFRRSDLDRWRRAGCVTAHLARAS